MQSKQPTGTNTTGVTEDETESGTPTETNHDPTRESDHPTHEPSDGPPFCSHHGCSDSGVYMVEHSTMGAIVVCDDCVGSKRIIREVDQ